MVLPIFICPEVTRKLPTAGGSDKRTSQKKTKKCTVRENCHVGEFLNVREFLNVGD